MRLLRPNWFEIDRDAPAANLRLVRRLVGPGRKIFAVVKANAYGFGTLEMARVFVEAGADALAVADLAAGTRLRGSGVSVPILLYPSALPEAAPEAIAHGLTPTLTDLEMARAYSRAATAPLGIFVKVDVGLERLGVPPEQAVKTIRAMLELPRLSLAGLLAHPHVPTPLDPAYIDWQLGRFTAVIDELVAEGVAIPIRMLASSALVLGFPQAYLNAVDPGRMLYGESLPSDPTPPGGLRPAFVALKSRLIEVKEVGPRERFADRAPFPLRPGMRLGVIPMGSSDGLLTLHAGRVLVRGRAAPILATPSLEHTRVDLTGVSEARSGDEVVLIGRQGREEITLDEVAARYGRQPFQVVVGIPERLTRVYLRREEVVTVATGAS